MLRLYIFIIIFACAASSCNVSHCLSKTSFLESYTSFVDEVEKKRLADVKNWSSVDEEFKDYVDRCYAKYKSEFSVEDKKVFWRKTLKYYYNRYNGDFQEAYTDIENKLSKDFKKDMDDMMANADDEIKSMFADLFKEDIKNKIDSILEGLNKWGDKLKETLDEMSEK